MALIVPTLIVVNNLSSLEKYNFSEVNPTSLLRAEELLWRDLNHMSECEVRLSNFLEEFLDWSPKSLDELKLRVMSTEFEYNGKSPVDSYLWFVNNYIREIEEPELDCFDEHFFTYLRSKIEPLTLNLRLLSMRKEILTMEEDLNILREVMSMNEQEVSREYFMERMESLDMDLSSFILP